MLCTVFIRTKAPARASVLQSPCDQVKCSHDSHTSICRYIYISLSLSASHRSVKLLGRAGGSCPEVAAVSTCRRPALLRCVLNTARTSTASKTPKPQPSTKLNSRRPGVRGPTVFLGVKTMRDIHACFCFQALSANASSKACISRSLPDLGATPRLS